MNTAMKTKGIKSREATLRSKKCKISIDKKLKGGIVKRYRTGALTKATAFLRREQFEQVRVSVDYALISNQGSFNTPKAALHFLMNNWADFLILRKEVK
jgi:hypothetical protein